jgi:hypothetical protein
VFEGKKVEIASDAELFKVVRLREPPKNSVLCIDTVHLFIWSV